mmetsp:Transcript_16157/g.26636  ORF Transcript_16157/g.26636 Transcript_16157/m.26636 type:complete len:647 (+) Transcript_16157:247-2187(+)
MAPTSGKSNEFKGTKSTSSKVPWFQDSVWPFRQRTMKDRKKDLLLLKNNSPSQQTQRPNVLGLISTRFIKSMFTVTRSVRAAANTIARTTAKRNIKILMRSSSELLSGGARKYSKTMMCLESRDDSMAMSDSGMESDDNMSEGQGGQGRELVLQSDQTISPKASETTARPMTERQISSLLVKSSKVCGQVTTLQLCSCYNVTDEVLTAFAGYPHPRLTNVVIKNCERVSAASVTRLFQSTMNLLVLHLEHLTCLNRSFEGMPANVRVLRVSFCIGFDDKCLVAIGRRCKDLQDLSLIDVPLVTGAGIKAVAGRALQTLKVTHAYKITDDALLEIAKNCSRLYHLELSRGPGYDPSTVSAIFQRCPCIQYFSLENCNMCGVIDLGFVPPTLQHLSFMANNRLAAVRGRGGDLQTLNLSYCKRLLADCVFGLQFELTNLHELDLSSCKLYDFDLLLLVRRAPHLTKLLMGGSNVSDACVRLVLRSCPHLIELNLVECSLLTDTALAYIAEEKARSNIPLRVLHLSEPIRFPTLQPMVASEGQGRNICEPLRSPGPAPAPAPLPAPAPPSVHAPPVVLLERSLSELTTSNSTMGAGLASLARSLSMGSPAVLGSSCRISELAVDTMRHTCKDMFIFCQSRLKRPRSWSR